SEVECCGLDGLSRTELLEDGKFVVMGLRSQRQRDLYFRQRKAGLGSVVCVNGSDRGPLTVQLLPCGSIAGRLVDHAGKPVPDAFIACTCESHSSEAANDYVPTDREGRFRANLLPGLKYSMVVMYPRQLRDRYEDLEVDPNQTEELGDLPLAAPRPAHVALAVTGTSAR